MPPEYPTEAHGKKNKKKLVLVLAIITLLISGVTTLGLLYYKAKTESQKQLDSKQAKISELEKMNTNYLKQIDALKKPEKEEAKPAATFREIPELGVKYALNDQVKDLTYSFVGGNGIMFSTVDLSISAPASGDGDDCTSSRGPGGSITKHKPADQFLGTTAEAAADSPERKDSFKKIGEFYFYYRGPDAPCSQKPDIQSKATQALTMSRAAFDSLQAIE